MFALDWRSNNFKLYKHDQYISKNGLVNSKFMNIVLFFIF